MRNTKKNCTFVNNASTCSLFLRTSYFVMVTLQHISKTLGGKRILDDVSLEIGAHEVVGLLGPNGAGKSTLMKILTGLWQADEGQVEVCGVDMRKSPHAVAPLIGYLPENNPLYYEMYVREYLLFMLSVSGVKMSQTERKKKVEEVIERVGLTPEVTKKIGNLSKGYKQRVGLAQTLLSSPKLFILDEPTTGLDPNQLEDIRAVIRDLSTDATVILSTHILQEVKEMCDRVVIIDRGSIRSDVKDIEGIDLPQLFHESTIVVNV